MDENFDAGVDWSEATNARERNRPERVKTEPKIDPYVSKILGRPVLANDPRLVSLVVKFKKQRGSAPEIDKMDNFMKDIDFLTELRKVFG